MSDSTNGSSTAESVLIEDFNPRTAFKQGQVVLILGKRNSGKSVLVVDMLRQMTHMFDYAFAMTDTDSSADLFEQFIPPSCVYRNCDEDLLDRFLRTLREIRKRKKARSILLLFDDLAAQKKLMKCKAMVDLHKNGRHLNIFYINLVQYVMDVPKECRAQVDVVISFIMKEKTVLQPLFFEFFSSMEWNEFVEAHNALTKDNGAMVLVKNSKDNTRFPGLFSYRADINNKKPFVLGGRAQWKLHHTFYVPPRIDEVGQSSIPSLDDRSGKLRGDEPAFRPKEGEKYEVNNVRSAKSKKKAAESLQSIIVRHKSDTQPQPPPPPPPSTQNPPSVRTVDQVC